MAAGSSTAIAAATVVYAASRAGVPAAGGARPSTTQLSLDLAEVSPARRTDPETAHAATQANLDARSVQRNAVYRHFQTRGHLGSTDYETGIALGILRTSAGKRRKELCDARLVRFSGERRPTDTGSTAIVWKLETA